MLNTEHDPMIERVHQRRTFSPGRVVGANKQPTSFLGSGGSSSLSTSPLGLLWGPHRESPTGRRFSGGEQEGEEANFYAEGSGATSSSDYNGFAGRYGNGNNLFATKFYSGAYESTAADEGTPDMDNLGANLDLDLSHLDLGLDFDDHDDPRSPKTPPYATSPAYPTFTSSYPTTPAQQQQQQQQQQVQQPQQPQQQQANIHLPNASHTPTPAGRGMRIPKPAFPSSSHNNYY